MTARPFSHVAVLNRGEAAVRFLRAARHWRRQHRIPLRILALYTHPDADAPFVRMASSALCLGEPLPPGEDGRPRSAYLDLERVVALAKGAGADAMWPGWGFAAERPELADACEAHGLVFLGPPSSATRRLGDKVAAKQLAERIGVPVSPWSGGPVDATKAAEVAARIGFPVLLKAAAGGGGRGIRRVEDATALDGALRAAAAEAAAAFGDASMFVERFVPEARHVEVQVLADTHGQVWALGTRDCSMQRRQQKIIEEAPAPGLAPAVEAAMCTSAIALAREVGYVGAGTAEFLLLPDNETFYFLEMNTRLQVEHTVTEEIYGVDLVGAQIDVGRGDPLPSPEPPPPRGAAVEVRLNAEDPDHGFAPRAGRLVRFAAPQGAGVRVDSGYETGSLVPTVFDSMLAKVITRGATRREALARMETALRDTVVVLDSGLTNRSLLLELVSGSVFRDAPVTTRWLDAHLAQRAAPTDRPQLGAALAAAALGDYLRIRRGHVANFLDEAKSGLPRNVPDVGPTTIRYLLGRRPVQVDVTTLGPEQLRMRCGDWEAAVRAYGTGERTLVIELGGHRFSIQRVATATDVHLEVEGVAHHFRRLSDGRVCAALPASVAQVHVQPGERVAAGSRLVTLEAMKMETVVESPLSGTVRAVHARPASQVAAGEVMIEIEEGSGEPPVEEAAPVLPARAEPPLDALRILEARLLGFDVTAAEAEAARAALDHDPHPPRAVLLRLLRAAVVQEQLFKSGSFDDARTDAKDSSLEQLAWFVHHRRLDEERLSPRFVRRLTRLLDLHGVTQVQPGFRLDNALLRLFQARTAEDTSALVLSLLHALARSGADVETPVPPPLEYRVIFEKLANEAVQRDDLQVATAAWNLIYHWFDGPGQREEAARLAAEASALLERFVTADTPPARAVARAALLDLPLAPLVNALAGPDGQRQPTVALRLLLERIYERGDHDDMPPLLGRLPCGRLWAARDRAVIGVMVANADDLPAAVAALPPDAEADVLLTFVPPEGALEDAARTVRPRWTAIWSDDGELRMRSWSVADGAMRERPLLRDIHPARPVAHELARFASFSLSRLPSPPGLLLLRAEAPNDERLVVLAEVERFEPVVDGHFVRVPAFEQVFLDAVQALRGALRAASGKPPALNRVALCVRPVVSLTREQLHALAERLGPATFDLQLEKVSLLGRFSLGTDHAAREHAVEWRDPTGLGPRVDVVMPRHRPVAVRSSYEMRVLAARRRRLFYPYEVVNWLTARDGAGGVERGRFEELELDESGARLVPVTGRPWGENRANLVIGLVTNWSTRFPEGLTRVLVIGDPTREMAALGEAECVRLVATFDYAEQAQLPVEWIALSAGARIAFDSGTENLDWTAAVLRRIVEFTARGGVVNVIVDGPCVGAQSYWNAEATMLMHCRGTLVMTPRGYMVLTGKRALEVSGSIAASTNEAIGGLEVMEPNGQAQYTAADLHGAYDILFRHYDYTHVAPGDRYTRQRPTSDRLTRDITMTPYSGPGGFTTVGDLFDESANAGRKKPFAVREVLRAVLDQDAPPLERWSRMAGGETAVTMHGQLGGQPVCVIGVESQSLPRRGPRPADGPATWMSGTLFPHSSRKVARAIRAASGVCPVIVLANLSGFDGSPESLRERQLEYGAEIGKAVVEFDGPILFCVIGRYHGGAYVVFSRRLSTSLDAVALEGSYASVIGGGAAAAVVFTRLVSERVMADPRVSSARAALSAAVGEGRREIQERYEAVVSEVDAEVQRAVAREFDAVHNVTRALDVGSLNAVLPARELRPALCERLHAAVALHRARSGVRAAALGAGQP